MIVETTGLADPAPVAQTFFVDDDIRCLYRLDWNCTLVDARHITQHLDDEKPEGVENEAVEQLAFADRILLNKIDLIENDDTIKDKEAELKKLELRIRNINSQAPIFRCTQSKIDPKNVLNLNAFNLEKVLEMDPEFLNTDGEHQHDDRVSSVACKFEGEMNHSKMQQYIQNLLGNPETASNLFRYKGVVAVRGMKEKYVFQGVHMLFTGSFVDTNKWKKGETRDCRFVLIGRNLDKEALIKGLEDCKAEETLRFNVGDRVQANVGKWVNGIIVAQWDEGNPYLIELQDGKRTNVWGPIDSDQYVRSLKRPPTEDLGRAGRRQR